MSEELIELAEQELKWSWPKFLIGWAKIITDRAFVAFVIFTYLGTNVLKYGKDSVVDIIVTGGWILVTVIYLLGAQGFNHLLRNSKAEIKVGVGGIK